MQVTELANDGLKRAYTVTVSAGEIASTRDKRLADIAKTVKLPGFRPGKVPMSIVKQRYGSAVMGEVLEQQVNDATQQVVTDRGLKPAMQPKIEVVKFDDGADLEFRVDLEVLPEIPMPEFAGIALERLKAEPSEEALDKALASIAERNGELADAEPRAAAKGDILVSDFVGRLPANLIANGLGLGARPGTGELPTGWVLEAPEGLSHEVAAIGTEKGLPYFDLAVKGQSAAAGELRLLPAGTDGLPVKGGDVLTFRCEAGLAEGALPGAAALTLGFDEIGGEARALREAAQPGGITATASEGATALRPLLLLALPQGEAGFTLRIGTARAFPGAEEPEAKAFAGGAATDMPIEVGGGGFIPGFTEQMEGMAPGDSRDIEVAFPADYGSAELAGRQARFAITAKALKTRKPRAVDDELAKAVGMENLEELKKAIRESMQREYDALSRLKLKRALLDQLAERADFAVPEGMVEAEFAQIWQRVEADLKAGRLDEEDKGKDEDALKADYRTIAARRIRLGLLLSEIGRVNNVQVGQQELANAVRQEAARYPGQEQQVLEFFRKNPQAAENLRAPLFEEKVVDFVIELAKVTDRAVAPEDLSAA